MLVALVQSIISASNEDLAPLEKARRGETRDRAKNDFLEKGGLHSPLQGAGAVPWECLHQKPHWRVFMIQSPRSRLVIA